MRLSVFALVALTLSFASVTTAAGQTPPDPTGHWEGAISAPFGEIPFHIDVTRSATGELVATYSRPENNLIGYPLTNVALNGKEISFDLRAEGTTTFRGVLLNNGTSIDGVVTAPIGSAQFNIGRMGEARLTAPPKNAAVGKELEGTWNGTLSIQGRHLRLVLTMTNHADGTATGTITSLDQGDIEFPLGLTQKALAVTLNAPAIGGDFFAGTLNGGGTELAGTFTQGPINAPLVFQRAK